MLTLTETQARELMDRYISDVHSYLATLDTETNGAAFDAIVTDLLEKDNPNFYFYFSRYHAAGPIENDYLFTVLNCTINTHSRINIYFDMDSGDVFIPFISNDGRLYSAVRKPLFLGPEDLRARLYDACDDDLYAYVWDEAQQY